MKWIIVGSGIIVNKFIKAFNGEANIFNQNEIVAILDIDKDSSKKLADKYGIKNTFEDINDINIEYDAVYLGTPNILHYEFSKKFLNLKKNVLCEKPLIDNHKKAIELFELAQTNGVRLLEAFMHIHNPLYIAHIGKVKRLEGNYSTMIEDIKNGIAETSNDKILKRNMMGGVIADVGVYPISLGVYLNGPVKDFEMKVLKYRQQVETNVEMTLNHINGAVTTSHFSEEGEEPEKMPVLIDGKEVCPTITFRHLAESRMAFEILNFVNQEDISRFISTSIETARLLELLREDANKQVDKMIQERPIKDIVRKKLINV